VAVSCEHSNELSGSLKGGEFLDQLSEYYFPIRTLLHVVRSVTLHVV
jgi:hypothetical protein